MALLPVTTRGPCSPLHHPRAPPGSGGKGKGNTNQVGEHTESHPRLQRAASMKESPAGTNQPSAAEQDRGSWARGEGTVQPRANRSRARAAGSQPVPPRQRRAQNASCTCQLLQSLAGGQGLVGAAGHQLQILSQRRETRMAEVKGREGDAGGAYLLICERTDWKEQAGLISQGSSPSPSRPPLPRSCSS